ncbi:PREDICTED: protein Dok-7 isoform X5 [Rhinopithecus bieti]|uniref:protein Dok-7 isoform X5 n=1 Tax=Rhinopithecus bieti TaxID=61621 RepID=UPI00083C3DB2|nr:PREDICTED: protein Dok-7 isoform X5 [Rhinopithecus bieti]
MTEDDRGGAGGGPGQAARRQEGRGAAGARGGAGAGGGSRSPLSPQWKSRWLVLRKPSPVADCLLMLVYKDKSERSKGLRERSSLTLEDICGLEPGLPYEGLAHTLAIVCLSQAVMLGFDSHEAMCAWDARIRYALGEVHRFHVTVAPGTKLESGPATLHLCNDILVLARDIPPAVMGQWKLSDLRRYGAVPSGFIFEGGTRCGYYPSPPGPSTVEERVAQEALETLQLEKRLSLLSHAGRPGSGAALASCSVSGDDRSLSSSSSEASHLDVSASSRLTAWPEQSLSSASTSQEGPRPAAAQAPGEAMLGASRPPPKPLRPRQLQEVGRQSSSDSGIATGSHSSYSGSLSSYAGSSLDVWRATDELGSLLSLPAAGAPEPSLCTCLPGAVEYQVPTSLRPHYDTPRSLRLVPRDHSPTSQGSPSDGAAGDSGGQTSAGCPSGWLGTRRRGLVMEAPQGSEATLPSPAPGEPWEAGSPHAGPSPAFFSACPVCGGLKGVAASAPGPVTARSGSPGPVAVDSPGPERPCGESPAYVNIPISPSSRKQLHYMGLELQEASEGVRGASASLYAQIDITATEMAHRVGAQHARAREEQLSELEQRKAAPQ